MTQKDTFLSSTLSISFTKSHYNSYWGETCLLEDNLPRQTLLHLLEYSILCVPLSCMIVSYRDNKICYGTVFKYSETLLLPFLGFSIYLFIYLIRSPLMAHFKSL